MEIPEGFCLSAAHRAHKAKTGEECTCPKYVRHPECTRIETREGLPEENPWKAPKPQPEIDTNTCWLTPGCKGEMYHTFLESICSVCHKSSFFDEEE